MNKFLSLVLMLCIVSVIGAQFQPGLPPLQWGTVTSGTQARAAQTGLTVLATEGDLQRWWQRSVGLDPATAPRGIRWGFEHAIAVQLGTRATGGFTVQVEGVDRLSASRARVRAVEVRPARNAAVIQAQTSPWVLIRVQNSPVSYELSWRQRDGGTWIGGGEVIDPGQRCRCDCVACRRCIYH